MEMIANDFNSFVEKVSAGIRTTLNTDFGQEMTEKLLRMKLQDNPNMSPEEWKKTKSEFMTFIFFQFVQGTPQAMEEMAAHVYNELQ